MFDKIKQLKEIQRILKEEKIEAERMGIRIIINGGLEIEQLTLNPDLSKEEQEKALVSCFNEAIKKAQVNAARKMSQVGGF